MRIGVVCAAEQRLVFLQKLLPDHDLIRVSAEQASPEGNLEELDWVFIDVPGLMESPALSAALRPLGSLLGRQEEDCPCIVRHDENGRLQLQCGRQTAAKRRASKGCPPMGTSTMIFQHVESASRDDSPLRAVSDPTCQS